MLCFSHGIDSIALLSPVLVVGILFSSLVLFTITKKISSSVSWQNVMGIEEKPIMMVFEAMQVKYLSQGHDILLKHVLCYQRTGMCPC